MNQQKYKTVQHNLQCKWQHPIAIRIKIEWVSGAQEASNNVNKKKELQLDYNELRNGKSFILFRLFAKPIANLQSVMWQLISENIRIFNLCLYCHWLAFCVINGLKDDVTNIVTFFYPLRLAPTFKWYVHFSEPPDPP